MKEKINSYILKHPFYFITISYILIFLVSSSIISYFSAKSLLVKHASLVLERLNTMVDIADDFQDYSLNHSKHRRKLEQSIKKLISENFIYIQLIDKKEKVVMLSIKTDDKKLKKKIKNSIEKIKNSNIFKHSFKIKHSAFL